MKLFEKYNIGNLELKNRMVMPPMCMYQVDKKDGKVNSFHKGHYTARAIGNVGLLIVEATGVTPNGRITDFDLGLWEDSQIDGLKEITEAVHREGSKIAIQLAHAGRKSETTGLRHIGPSKLSFNNDEYDYDQATKEEILEVVESFKKAAKRADKAGFDGIEIHAAHGYLIHSFISPLSNKRDDEYGKDRFLLLKQIINGIKEIVPNKPVWMRISATDFLEGGIQVDDWINFLKENPNFVDIIHVSAGGLQNAPIKVYPGYMLQYSRKIKEQTGYDTIGVGVLNQSDLVNFALENGECDLVACGRELLRNPNFLSEISKERKVEGFINKSYLRAYR